MTPILIAIPFWQGDKSQAIALCRIIAGLQSHHVGTTAHILLVCRQDCAIDHNMINILKPKFQVFTYHSSSALKGWPSGSNGMFGSTMIHIANTAVKNYECVYWMEPDAIPISPNWFWCLVEEWRKRHPTSLVVGCRSDCNGNGTGDHVTGCALYHPNIARLMPYLTTCDNVAWDYQCRDKIVAVAGSTGLIQNRYRERNVDAGVIEEPGVVIIHGVKDDSVINSVAKKYNIKLN